ncbi:MAG TPA: sulfurtransferase [Actinobacteria bacterium]|nr:sulfurtransferase [Actinomycetota bacterium]
MSAATPPLPHPLISVEQLHDDMTGEISPVLLDVRWTLTGAQPDAYRQAHIPGAVFCDLDADLSDHSIEPDSGGRHPLPTADSFTATMRRLGVSPDRSVVVYDAKDSTAAARAWWVLTYFGHRDVRVLDGGLRAWVSAGREVTSGDESPTHPGTFTAQPGHLSTVTTEQVVDADSLRLLDARAAERFRGDIEPMDPIPGHIPGAVNTPTADLVDAEGRFLPASALREKFAELGVTPADPLPVVAYCGSGVTACHTILALRLIDIPAALYPGSYSLWCRLPGAKIARGPH